MLDEFGVKGCGCLATGASPGQHSESCRRKAGQGPLLEESRPNTRTHTHTHHSTQGWNQMVKTYCYFNKNTLIGMLIILLLINYSLAPLMYEY